MIKLNLDIVRSGTQEEFEEHLKLIQSTDDPNWELKKWIEDQISETKADMEYFIERGRPRVSEEYFQQSLKEGNIYISKLELMLKNL
jgi:hypothetical protein